MRGVSRFECQAALVRAAASIGAFRGTYQDAADSAEGARHLLDVADLFAAAGMDVRAAAPEVAWVLDEALAEADAAGAGR